MPHQALYSHYIPPRELHRGPWVNLFRVDAAGLLKFQAVERLEGSLCLVTESSGLPLQDSKGLEGLGLRLKVPRVFRA